MFSFCLAQFNVFSRKQVPATLFLAYLYRFSSVFSVLSTVTFVAMCKISFSVFCLCFTMIGVLFYFVSIVCLYILVLLGVFVTYR